jgi:hypothetical protein
MTNTSDQKYLVCRDEDLMTSLLAFHVRPAYPPPSVSRAPSQPPTNPNVYYSGSGLGLGPSDPYSLTETPSQTHTQGGMFSYPAPLPSLPPMAPTTALGAGEGLGCGSSSSFIKLEIPDDIFNFLPLIDSTSDFYFDSAPSGGNGSGSGSGSGSGRGAVAMGGGGQASWGAPPQAQAMRPPMVAPPPAIYHVDSGDWGIPGSFGASNSDMGASFPGGSFPPAQPVQSWGSYTYGVQQGPPAP